MIGSLGFDLAITNLALSNPPLVASIPRTMNTGSRLSISTQKPMVEMALRRSRNLKA
jgi:hypothetical protein